MGAGPSTLSLCVIARVLNKDSWFSPLLRTAPPPADGGGGGGVQRSTSVYLSVTCLLCPLTKVNNDVRT